MIDCREHIDALFQSADLLGLFAEQSSEFLVTSDSVTFISPDGSCVIGLSSQLFECDFYWSEIPLQKQQMGLYFNALGKDSIFLKERTFELVTKKNRNKIAHQAMFCVALWLNFTVEDAAVLASAYSVSYCIQATSFGQWPRDFHFFPTVLQNVKCDFLPLPSGDFSFYPIVNSVDWISEITKVKASIIQLRMKKSSPFCVEEAIQTAVLMCNRIIVNDHWQMAIKHQAFGVHLGQEDMVTADFIAIQKSSLRLGLSTHGYYEILKAMALKPSYIALGHVFPTPTKIMPSQPQGLARLRLYQTLIGERFPTFAIGGMDLKHASSVYKTGVTGIAAVRCVIQADSIQEVFEQFLQTKKASQREVYAE
jgi:thiamine-phosphate pyrophosphorylase